METFAPLSPTGIFSRGTDKWPSYALCLDKAPRNHDDSGPDRSRADYVWRMIAISWGHSVDNTAGRLLQERRKAREKGPSYAMRTAHQAKPPSNAAGQQQRFRLQRPARAAVIG